jgi:hypothetical protein
MIHVSFGIRVRDGKGKTLCGKPSRKAVAPMHDDEATCASCKLKSEAWRRKNRFIGKPARRAKQQGKEE